MGLQVTPTTGHSDRFIEGERIIVQLVQAGYDGYLYVDYYTVEGQLVHLYPNPGESDSGRVLRGGERFNVRESARTWSVGPPFGQELITVISSPSPLYKGDWPEFEDARVSLPARRAIGRTSCRERVGQCLST